MGRQETRLRHESSSDSVLGDEHQSPRGGEGDGGMMMMPLTPSAASETGADFLLDDESEREDRPTGEGNIG